MFGGGLQEAVSAALAARKTWGDETTTLKLESNFDAAVAQGLEAAGHDVEMVEEFSDVMGHAGAVVVHPDGLLEGATDPRSDGSVASA